MSLLRPWDTHPQARPAQGGHARLPLAESWGQSPCCAPTTVLRVTWGRRGLSPSCSVWMRRPWRAQGGAPVREGPAGGVPGAATPSFPETLKSSCSTGVSAASCVQPEVLRPPAHYRWFMVTAGSFLALTCLSSGQHMQGRWVWGLEGGRAWGAPLRGRACRWILWGVRAGPARPMRALPPAGSAVPGVGAPAC